MSEPLSLADVGFTEEDVQLFATDDTNLRAGAVHYSVLPRLHVVLHEAIAACEDLLGESPLLHSTASTNPAAPDQRRRVRRPVEFAMAGLEPRLDPKRWTAVRRHDGKAVALLPVGFGFQLDRAGLAARLWANQRARLDRASWTRVLDVRARHADVVGQLAAVAGFAPAGIILSGEPPFVSVRRLHEQMLKHESYEHEWSTVPLPLPAQGAGIDPLVESLVLMYPLYRAYLATALGEADPFEELVGRLNERWLATEHHLQSVPSNDDAPADGVRPVEASAADAARRARELAETHVRVPPSVNYQAMKRDNFECVACGRAGGNGVILHVDHIVPRSKGGADDLSNYQTLCQDHNLGKGNRDDTDIRALKARRRNQR